MEVKAVGKYIRVSPFKARRTANLIRGKRVQEAMSILKLTSRKSSRIIEKILKSAMANAENNFNLSPSSLYIKKALVDKGSTLKRIKPRARGRDDVIRKRTSHITIVLEALGE